MIKKIIRESLLNEIGEASALPYKWRLKENTESSVTYKFRTKGGSDMLIEVNFILIQPYQFQNMEIEVEHPYYYWDTEFLTVQHKKDVEFYGDDRSMTISSSEYKTDKVEVFRIMSTLSAIIKDLMSIRKVRGFAFKPASDGRGKLFLKYFERQLPHAEIKTLDEGATVITVDKSVKYVEGEDPYYDDIYKEEEPTFREKIKTKFTKDDYNEWYYNTEKGRWERKGLLNKARRKLGVDDN